MKAEKKVIAGQESWVVSNGTVELSVTVLGGHMAPVTFYSDTGKPVRPYHVAPWAEESGKIDDPVLIPLRGDFFCMPFGAGSTYRKDMYPTHGETASAKWKNADIREEGDETTFFAQMDTKIKEGTVTKKITLKEGHNALYIQHTLEGYSGQASLGHHATLKMPAVHEGLHVSTSPTQFGFTGPRPEANLTDTGGVEYYALPPARKFTKIDKVPTLWKDVPYTDCSAFPTRMGFEDILGVAAKQGNKPSWTAAAVPSEGYLWFSLKDPKVLPLTLFWMSMGGRHMPPWNGRNVCLGLEEICGFFAAGMADSAKKNFLNDLGVATTVKFSANKPTEIRNIQGVVKIPKSFDRVKKGSFSSGWVTFTSDSGKEVKTQVDWEFLGME